MGAPNELGTELAVWVVMIKLLVNYALVLVHSILRMRSACRLLYTSGDVGLGQLTDGGGIEHEPARQTILIIIITYFTMIMYNHNHYS
jgi:hypothetical protein